MKSIVPGEPTPADLKKYGFDKPEATVTLNAGSTRATLLLGAKAEEGTIYARDVSKPVVMTVEVAPAHTSSPTCACAWAPSPGAST